MRAATLLLLTLVHLIASCTVVQQQAAVPTLAVLPSETPTATWTAPPTATYTATLPPTETPTPNLLETQVAAGNLTNEASQSTLAAMWTQMVATSKFTPTTAPSEAPREYAAQESQLRIVLTDIPGVESITSLRMSPSGSSSVFLYVSADVETGYATEDTADRLRKAAVAVEPSQALVLLVYLTDDTETASYTWSDSAQVWESSNDTTVLSTPTAQTLLVHDTEARTYYVRSTANARECPRLNCAVVAQFHEQDTVTVLGWAQGDTFAGTDIWFRIAYGSQTPYIHSSLLSVTRPVAGPTAIPPHPIVIITTTPVYIYEPPTYEPYVPPSIPIFQPSTPSGSGGGATALCNDGTLSYSANRRGTCSHHGGVAVWYR